MIHWEYESGISRTASVFARVDRACSTMIWGKPSWSSLNTSCVVGMPFMDFSLSTNVEESLPASLVARYTQYQADCACTNLEEGYLDLRSVKEIMVDSYDKDHEQDFREVCKKYSIDSCIGLMYGSSLSDNRFIFLLCPSSLCKSVFIRS